MSRAKRTKEFRNFLEVQWTDKYWSFVLDNTDKPCDWCGISRNPNITWDIIRDNPDKSWNWHGLSKNPNITWEIVKDNPNKPLIPLYGNEPKLFDNITSADAFAERLRRYRFDGQQITVAWFEAVEYTVSLVEVTS